MILKPVSCQQSTRRADEFFQYIFKLVLDLIIIQINKCIDNSLEVMKYLAFLFIEIINEIKIKPNSISKNAQSINNHIFILYLNI